MRTRTWLTLFTYDQCNLCYYYVSCFNVTQQGELIMPTETTIILAIIGMIGLFATATVYQRANRITSRYYKK